MLGDTLLARLSFGCIALVVFAESALCSLAERSVPHPENRNIAPISRPITIRMGSTSYCLLSLNDLQDENLHEVRRRHPSAGSASSAPGFLMPNFSRRYCSVRKVIPRSFAAFVML